MKKAIFMLLILFTAISIFPGSVPDYWPTESWQYKNDYDFSELEKTLSRNPWKEMHSLIVIKDGYIVFEKYFREKGRQVERDELHAMYSATKSVNSLLMGILIDKGYIENENEKIRLFFDTNDYENSSELKNGITIKHLLTNTSGFEWDESKYSYGDPRNIYTRFTASDDRVSFVLNLPVINKPGDRFNYNTGASYLVSAIISEVTGMTALEFADKNLFAPLGIKDRIWFIDEKGINKLSLNLKPLDMAKIGLLVLNRGCWDGLQIISSEWIEKSTIKQAEISSSSAFGYHWWLYAVNGIEIVGAYGYGGQRISIIPSHDLVVVSTANIHDGFPFKLLTNYILKVFDD